MLKKEAENAVSYYKRKMKGLLRELESQRHNVEVFDGEGAALLNLLLRKNDELLERSSRVLRVMSIEGTKDYLLEDDSHDSSDCSTDDA